MTEKPFLFFSEERSRFFRALNSSRRELVSASIRAIYERLHGPTANFTANLTKQEFKDLLYPIVVQYEATLSSDVIDELSQDADPSQMAGLVLKALIRDGWLEQFADRHGLVTAFRLSRPGKAVAEALWSLDRPSRSRQRNMRSCRNALAAVTSGHGDAHDLVDAYEFAERVIEDLNEATEYLQDRIRVLTQEASIHTQWQDFMDFLDRFQTEYAKQLTIDSATLNKSAITQSLEKLRELEGSPRYDRLKAQLGDVAKWVAQDSSGDDPLAWLLNRMEEIVCAAHDQRQPGFMKAMDTYIKRVTGLVQQSMMLRSSGNRMTLANTLQALTTSDEGKAESLLAAIGHEMGLTRVRLVDPAVFRVKVLAPKRKATTVSVPPRATRDARLEAAVRNAAARAFQMPNNQAVASLEELVSQAGGTLRLSELPMRTASDVMLMIQGVEAVRGDNKSGIVAQKLEDSVVTPFFMGSNYAFHQESSSPGM